MDRAVTLLGVNIDHVATVRQARRERMPSPVEAALAAVKGGADGITAHLREDRRHIQDADIEQLRERLSVPLNLEMAATEDILRVAERVRPAWTCLVPEKRQELTTEGGLDVAGQKGRIAEAVKRLHAAGVKVSLFIEPTVAAVDASKAAGADAVELHTGVYARVYQEGRSALASEVRRIAEAARRARESGIIVNAGHGLDYENVAELARVFPFHEFNIGFAIIARAVFSGLESAVHEMKEKMAAVCAES
ncbi:MAG: pyridoxine 5'-phosphate synthase [Elusimicrobia bacterium]|nr:pyridoxine 5'-phosphate synthase [Elusimicrobiota bacterium]